MKIHTLNSDDDDRRPNLERSDEDESGDEEGRPPAPQEYYVGGSEHSGQQVLDPRNPDANPVGMFNTRLNSSGPSRSGAVVSLI